MISLKIDECQIDILPVVNGLAGEAEKVHDAYGKYEAYAASLGIESLEALRKREEIGVDDIEVSELDIVYAKRMAEFGDIQTPSPAFCELVDLCASDGKTVIPLDMNDEEFDNTYLENVKATEFTSVHRLAKKIFKAKLNTDSPESLAKDIDRVVSKVKGFRLVNEKREEYISKEIIDIAKYRKSLLCIIECERVDGVCAHLSR